MPLMGVDNVRCQGALIERAPAGVSRRHSLTSVADLRIRESATSRADRRRCRLPAGVSASAADRSVAGWLTRNVVPRVPEE